MSLGQRGDALRAVHPPSSGTRSGLVYAGMGLVLIGYLILLVADPNDAQSAAIGGWGSAGFELVAGVLCVVVGRRRRPGSAVPAVLGAGVIGWALGDVVRTIETLGGATAPSPSLADVFYLSFFALSYVAVLLLVRGETRRLAAHSWLDGAVAGLGAGAVCAAFVFSSLVRDTHQSVLSTAVNLAYPIGDVLLLLLVAGGTAMLAGQRKAPWVLLAMGMAINVCGDTANLLQGSVGGSGLGVIIDAIAWPASSWLMAVAMSIAPGPIDPMASQRPPGFVFPGLAAGAGVLILCVGTLRSVNHVATALATAALGVVVLRTWSSVRVLRSHVRDRERDSVTDHLTGLPNRRRLFDALDVFFAQLPAGRPPLAFLFVDLNGFKAINDTFGHAVGDDVLRQVGLTLARALRPSDLLARVGGDEFAAMLVGADAGVADQIALRLAASLSQPFALDGVWAKIGASIGIALAPGDAADGAELMRCADAAMYRAKREAAPFAHYDRQFDSAANKLQLADELGVALGSDGLVLHYQPQLELHGGQITSVEALVRWPHPKHGLIPPLKFLPLAEEAGLMGQLTDWVLGQALAQCSAWRAAGRDLRVSVNVSAGDFANPDFPAAVCAHLARAELDATSLVVEITETSIIEDFDRAQHAVRQLTALGVGVSIDDFGAGFTSLAYLSGLAVQELKLDRQLIAPLAGGVTSRSSDLVRATIKLGHALGLVVVAEGIEDDGALELLRAMGCDVAQGYGVGRPAAPHELAFPPRRSADDELLVGPDAIAA